VKLVLDMTLLLVISGVCSLIFVRIKMPPILGYLAAGIILGPTMLHDLSVDQLTVVVLSNIGIVMLMFWIGLEQNAAKLRSTGSKLILIVSLEMTLVLVICYLAGMLMGFSSVQAIFLGAIMSGTSTAVVVSVLKSRGTIRREQASTIIGITVFEDVGQVIILTLAASLLAGDAPALGSVVNMVIGITLFFGVTIALGMAFIPRILDRIGRKYPSEVLFLISAGLCFTLAFISSTLGLSIAIGAFLMGLMISRSVHSDELLAKIVPMKELFMAVFFISIGMLVDLRMIWENLWLVAAIAATFMLAKSAAVGISTYILGHPARDSFLIATSLLAMGEFAFIIVKIAFDAGVFSQHIYSVVIGAALVTMVAMPVLAKVQVRLYCGLSRMVPAGIRSAVGRMDGIKSASLTNLSLSSPGGRKVRRDIIFIFLDFLIIISALLLYRFLASLDATVGFIADTLGSLPEILVFSLLLLVVIMASANIYSHLGKVSRTLTDQVMKSKNLGENARSYLYRIFTGIWSMTLMTVIVILVIPFVPGYLLGHPAVLLAFVMVIFSILLVGWKRFKGGYVNFHSIIAGQDGKKG